MPPPGAMGQQMPMQQQMQQIPPGMPQAPTKNKVDNLEYKLLNDVSFFL